MGARLIALSIALVVALAACEGGDGQPREETPTQPSEETPTTNSFSGNGVTFEYPGEWTEIAGEEINDFNGTAWDASVGIDEKNGVKVSAGEMLAPITAKNLEQNLMALLSGAGQVVALDQGRIEGAPAQIDVGGLPAIRFEWSEGHAAGTPGIVQGTMFLIFDKRTEYMVNCRAEREVYEEVLKGCEQIADTFEVE